MMVEAPVAVAVLEDRVKSNHRQRVWNAVDDYTAEIYSLWHHESSRAVIQARIAQHFVEGGAAADFGCGAGFWLDSLSRASSLYAVDFSKSLLAKARQDAPEHCQFLEGDITDSQLSDELDFALCLNALMPESHSDALDKLQRLRAALKPGGKLLLVTFSQECASSFINLQHFQAAREGEEPASLERVLDWFATWQNNPLGYIKHRNTSVNKFWNKDEAEAVFSMVGGLKVIECFRVPREWDGPQYGNFSPWFWGWVLERMPG